QTEVSDRLRLAATSRHPLVRVGGGFRYVCIGNNQFVFGNGQGKGAGCTTFIIRGLAMGVGYVIDINDYERSCYIKTNNTTVRKSPSEVAATQGGE
ncbi:unnamed protein product, partial [Brassica oleracea]